jgi:hypothetical protein
MTSPGSASRQNSATLSDRLRAKYTGWLATLPKCIGFKGGCDGDLEATEHEDNCPMKGLKPLTSCDVWKAAYCMGARDTRQKIVEDLQTECQRIGGDLPENPADSLAEFRRKLLSEYEEKL